MPHFKAVVATTQSSQQLCACPTLRHHNPFWCAVLSFRIRPINQLKKIFTDRLPSFQAVRSSCSTSPAGPAAAWSPARQLRLCQQINRTPSILCTPRVSFSPEVESGLVGGVEPSHTPVGNRLRNLTMHFSPCRLGLSTHIYQQIPTHQRAARGWKEQLSP